MNVTCFSPRPPEIYVFFLFYFGALYYVTRRRRRRRARVFISRAAGIGRAGHSSLSVILFPSFFFSCFFFFYRRGRRLRQKNIITRRRVVVVRRRMKTRRGIVRAVQKPTYRIPCHAVSSNVSIDPRRQGGKCKSLGPAFVLSENEEHGSRAQYKYYSVLCKSSRKRRELYVPPTDGLIFSFPTTPSSFRVTLRQCVFGLPI